MKTSNPVLARLGQAAERERSAGYAQPGPYGYGQPGIPQQYPGQPGSPVAPQVSGTMTLDDVVVKTVTLLAILGVAAAAAWIMVPDSLLGVAWIGAAVVGLVLGLIISFSRVANRPWSSRTRSSRARSSAWSASSTRRPTRASCSRPWSPPSASSS